MSNRTFVHDTASRIRFETICNRAETSPELRERTSQQNFLFFNHSDWNGVSLLHAVISAARAFFRLVDSAHRSPRARIVWFSWIVQNFWYSNKSMVSGDGSRIQIPLFRHKIYDKRMNQKSWKTAVSRKLMANVSKNLVCKRVSWLPKQQVTFTKFPASMKGI